jgi:acyl carrier protein
MDIQKFIENFAAQFDETPTEEFKEETIFRNLPEWSSMIGMSVIAMVDEEYHIRLKGEHISNSNTIRDIYNKIVEISSL